MLAKIILGNFRPKIFDSLCISFRNNVPGIKIICRTVKIMIYIHIMFGHLFDNLIKMVNWLFDYNLRELRKLKVFSSLQSD